jgi:hypothetical protein
MEVVVDSLQVIGAGVTAILVLMVTDSLKLVLFLSFIGLCGILLTSKVRDSINIFNKNKLNFVLGINTFALAQLIYWTLQGLICLMGILFSLSSLPQSLEIVGVLLFFAAIALMATYSLNSDADTNTHSIKPKSGMQSIIS